MPNAGKSSIYNILTSGEKNIIHKDEGTTRDWHVGNIKNINNVYIYDTPGIIIDSNNLPKLHFAKLFSLVDKLIYVIDYKIENYEKELASINKFVFF